MQKFLVIVGVSGSGKTVLEQNLLKHGIFHKLVQFTTRKPRLNESNGNPYIFIQESTYDYIKDKLIGRVQGGNFSNKYGTLPDIPFNKVGTIILSKEGLTDFLTEYVSKHNVEFFVLGLDIDVEDIPLDVLSSRNDRNLESIKLEREVLKFADKVLKFTPPNYPTADEVLKLLKDVKFI